MSCCWSAFVWFQAPRLKPEKQKNKDPERMSEQFVAFWLFGGYYYCVFCSLVSCFWFCFYFLVFWSSGLGVPTTLDNRHCIRKSAKFENPTKTKNKEPTTNRQHKTKTVPAFSLDVWLLFILEPRPSSLVLRACALAGDPHT